MKQERSKLLLKQHCSEALIHFNVVEIWFNFMPGGGGREVLPLGDYLGGRVQLIGEPPGYLAGSKRVEISLFVAQVPWEP